MALKFEKKEAIEFGDLKVAPIKIDVEMRLRLQGLAFKTEEELEEAKKLLSECFGGNAGAVKKFMDENMSAMDLQILQGYLLSGPTVMRMMIQELAGSVKEQKDA